LELSVEENRVRIMFRDYNEGDEGAFVGGLEDGYPLPRMEFEEGFVR